VPADSGFSAQANQLFMVKVTSAINRIVVITRFPSEFCGTTR